VSGTPGIGCATVIGQTCTAVGAVSGLWTKTGSGVFTFTATAPVGAIVGGTPVLFIPTTVNPNGEQFTCSPTSATLTTTCTGSTRGDPPCGGILTVDFPLGGGGFGVSNGIITCTPTGTLVICKQIQGLNPSLGLGGVNPGGSTVTFTTATGGPTIPSITVAAGQGGPVCAAGMTVAAGPVAITEVVPPGFTLQSVTGGTLAGNTATATITARQTTTLTFVNVPITVIIPGSPLQLLQLIPPPPPALLPPPPAPAASARAPAAFPEVPVIPEADSLGLVTMGMLAFGAILALRSRRRGQVRSAGWSPVGRAGPGVPRGAAGGVPSPKCRRQMP
jgi:hypothetical protein